MEEEDERPLPGLYAVELDVLELEPPLAKAFAEHPGPGHGASSPTRAAAGRTLSMRETVWPA